MDGRARAIIKQNLGQKATAGAMQAVTLSKIFIERLEATPNAEVLDSEQLTRFTELAPKWSFFAGISDGLSVKTYVRIINETELTPSRRPGMILANDTNKKLTDPEHCDGGLAAVFDTASFSGVSLNTCQQNYTILFEGPEPGPLTYRDVQRVLDADRYLITNGYIQAPATSSPA